MGRWTVAIHTPLSAMAPSVTLNVMRVSGWEEHQLWHATAQVTGARIYQAACVSAQQDYFQLTSFICLLSCSNSLFLSPSYISAVQCEAISTLFLPLSMNCSHPLGTYSFGTQCLFTCDEGFSLNGTEVLVCSSTGFWSDSLPTCTGKLIFFWHANMLVWNRYNVYHVHHLN